MTGTELIASAKKADPRAMARLTKKYLKHFPGRIAELSAAGDVLPVEAKAMTFEEAKS